MGLKCAYTDVLQRRMVTVFSLPYYFLNNISFLYLYFKDTVCNTYNLYNMC